jgi:hypothetical protein
VCLVRLAMHGKRATVVATELGLNGPVPANSKIGACWHAMRSEVGTGGWGTGL